MAETPLLPELRIEQALQLGGLTAHPGYPVLQELIRAAVERANAAVIVVNPDDNNYNRMLAAAQQEARAMNKFAKWVLRSILYHSQVAIVNGQTDEAKILEKVHLALNPPKRGAAE